MKKKECLRVAELYRFRLLFRTVNDHQAVRGLGLETVQLQMTSRGQGETSVKKSKYGGLVSSGLVGAVTLWFISFVMPPVAFAQLAGGSISGVVRDASGAVIPNALVSIQNVATNTVRQVTSNSDGLYSAPNLIPDSYQITVEATGFQKLLRTGVTVTVGGELVLDLTLSVGQVTQSVQVTAQAPLVETASSSIDATVEQTSIVDLPLNGRDWTQLATLQPGVNTIRTQAASNLGANRAQRGFGNQLTDNGHRPSENTYLVDGININDYTNAAPGNVIGENLGVDAIQEFNVVTTNYSAEYGRTSGAAINATTRSGTNQLHGTAYFFDRDKIFDARNFFARQIPPFSQGQYGVSAGGPIIKDKTFIFGDFEGITQNLGESFNDVIPSAAARAGNMCSIPVASGPNACSPHTITIGPAVAPYLALYPDPAKVPVSPLGGSSDNGDTVVYRTTGLASLHEHYFTVRVDQQFSSRDSLSGTYFYDHSPQTLPDSLVNVLNEELSNRQMAGVTETHVFSSALLNVARVGFSHATGEASAPDKAINPAEVDGTLMVPGIFHGVLPPGPPALSISGLTGVTGLGNRAGFHHYDSYQAGDDLSFTHSVHTFKFGFAVERIQYNVSVVLGNLGTFSYIKTGSTSALQNFLLGNPSSAFGQIGGFPTKAVEPRDSRFASYINDDWRIRKNLTLNLGVRYETLTNPTDNHNNFSRLNTYGAPAGTGPCPNIFPAPFTSTNVPGCPVPIAHLWNTNPTLRNFEPRIGFSWDPFQHGTTAVRGGFGIFDVLPLPYVWADGFFSQYPYELSFTATSLPAGSFPNLLPYVSPNTPGARYVDPNPKRNYAMNWNLNVQHQFNQALSATVAYVGTRTVHQTMTNDNANFVQPTLANGVYTWPLPVGSGTILDPNVANLRSMFWDGNASYEGLQGQLQFRATNRLLAQVSYTYGRCFSDGDSSQFVDQFQNSLPNLFVLQPSLTHGPCDFDVTHNVTANYIYTVPGPKSGALGYLAGGWQVLGIMTISTGQPFTVLTGGDPLGMKSDSPIDFPDRVPACNPYQANFKSLSQPLYLNQSCFTIAPVTAAGAVLGNNGRNRLYGPGLVNFDMSLLKNIPVAKISESFNVQLRFEFFNIFNHTNFAVPTNVTLGSSLGLLSATATPERQIQFGAKIIW